MDTFCGLLILGWFIYFAYASNTMKTLKQIISDFEYKIAELKKELKEKDAIINDIQQSDQE